MVQITAGLRDNMDAALFVPYSFYRYPQGGKLEGFSDAGVFIKHIPLQLLGVRLGYKAQLNLDTGKEGIGYGAYRKPPPYN